MAWSGLVANQWVSRNDLQDAVTTGVFTLKPAQTIPAGDNWVTKTEVETWINATVTTATASQWPQKSWIIPDAPAGYRTYSSYNGPYQIAGFCDLEAFPDEVYTTDTDPPYTVVYSDTALTTAIVGAIYLIGAVTNKVSAWFKASSGGTGTWVSSIMTRVSQVITSTNLTADSGTSIYTKQLGEAMYVPQGGTIDVSVDITAMANIPGGAEWRLSWISGGVNPGGSVIWSSAWTPVAVSSIISQSGITSTCDHSFMRVEFNSGTVIDGSSIDVEGGIIIN